MTEAEIIKALECCQVDSKRDWDCDNCPYNDNCSPMHKDALDLINRKNEEIEKLREKCSKCGEKTTKTILHLQEILAEKNDQIKQKDDEIDRLNKAIQVQEIMLGNKDYAIKKARSEAIKEVFDELEARLCVHSFTSKSTEYSDGQLDCMEWVDSKIAELAKEMGVETDV